MVENSYEVNMSKWAFSKLKPHLKENIKTSIRVSDKPTHVLVSFVGFSPEQKKNIDDIVECLSIPAERNIAKTNRVARKPNDFILEEVPDKRLTQINPSDTLNLADTAEQKTEERE